MSLPPPPAPPPSCVRYEGGAGEADGRRLQAGSHRWWAVRRGRRASGCKGYTSSTWAWASCNTPPLTQPPQHSIFILTTPHTVSSSHRANHFSSSRTVSFFSNRLCFQTRYPCDEHLVKMASTVTWMSVEDINNSSSPSQLQCFINSPCCWMETSHLPFAKFLPLKWNPSFFSPDSQEV